MKDLIKKIEKKLTEEKEITEASVPKEFKNTIIRMVNSADRGAVIDFEDWQHSSAVLKMSDAQVLGLILDAIEARMERED